MCMHAVALKIKLMKKVVLQLNLHPLFVFAKIDSIWSLYLVHENFHPKKVV